MSLRSELHAAYDELGPEEAGLSERVVMTVLRDRPRRAAWSLRLRAPLSLVAVFVVIALVAGALVGGRLVADWKSLTAPPQPAAPQTPLQKLESRPLQMHRQSANHCVDGPYNKDGDIGAGPIHVTGSSVLPQTTWGSYSYHSLYSDGPVKGPLLARARDLVTFQPIVFVSQNAAGPVVGTDVLDGQPVQQHLELVISDPASPYAWQFESGVQDQSHCQGWQIDSPGFSETFTVSGR